MGKLLMTASPKTGVRAQPTVATPPAPAFLRRHWLPLLAAALCNVPAIAQVAYLPALFSVACIAYVLQQAGSLRQAFQAGAAYIIVSAALLNYWMVPTLVHYTGGNWVVALLCYFASWLLLAPFFGLQFGLFAWLRRREDSAAAAAWNALLFAALWVLTEWARAWLFSAVPWMAFSWGSALGGNSLLIQPAAFGGIFALTFLLALPAYLIAAAWRERKARLAVAATLLILLQVAGGGLALRHEEAKAAARPHFRAALVQPALSAGALWDRQNVNAVVQHLLRLNGEAAARRADLNVWTETTVPWTFREDDDFVQALLASLKGSRTHTLLGMTTDPDSKDGPERTSVYLLDPAGAVRGRYDKQELLAGAERPFLGGVALPFRSGTATRFAPGLGAPLPAPWGAAGVLLCNEATIPAPALRHSDNGATWLAVVGNDAWFADTYVALGHFYQCRIRAVENRRDVLVNINAASAGVIRASGAIAARFDGREPAIREATVQPSSEPRPRHLLFAVLVGLLLLTSNRFFSLLFSTPQNPHL